MLRFLSLTLIILSFSSNINASPLSLDAVGQYEVEEKDFVYAIVDGIELRARSYRPIKSGILPN
jgi:hypothetical protein